MKALVTGAGGQVARALAVLCPPGVQLLSLGRAELDIGDPAAVQRAVASQRPDLIINAAAYTAVDKAEGEPELAQRVNGAGPGHLAAAAREHGARLLHISTDFVFDGTQSRPYAPADAPRPLGAYGASKLLGEERVQAELGGRAFILRTAWVYDALGRNFMNTMLKLMRERDGLRVVADQVGAPTHADSIARALWAAAGRPALAGIHHWTDAGVASWYDFAIAIQEEALARGLLPGAVPVQPIATADYPTPARRPAYSVLDCASTAAALGLTRPHWRASLRACLDGLAARGRA